MSRKKATPVGRSKPAVTSRASVWGNPWILSASLLLITALAYSRVWQCGYIWDDNFHVTQNPTLRDLHGLWRIWFEVAATPQYYPLVHTTFWLEHHLWGLNPVGYHVVNVFLHALAAVLLWRVLCVLRIPGAWLAAAIFAVHPVQVESVAWVSERKNVLSALFYFAAALTYLRFVAMREAATVEKRAVLFYFGSLALFVCALLSKTVTCSLPAALLLIGWWKNGHVQRRNVWPVLPFFAIGLGLGLGTIWIERHHVGALGPAWSLTFTERFLIAGRALWFYAGKLLWPAELTFIYPRWHINVSSAAQWLPPLAAAAMIATLWRARKRIGRGALVAVLFFAGTLAPALGFVNVFPFRYSFVADHFQYLAGVGLMVLFAAGLNRLPRVIPALLLISLAALTWMQVGVYRDLESLWTDVVKKNPDSWMAQDRYAAVLVEKGRKEEAMPHLQKALEIDPNNPETQNNLGSVLLQLGRADEAMPFLQKALQLKPDRAAVIHYNLGCALLLRGRKVEAIPYLQRALEIDPTYLPAETKLGNALLQAGRVTESLAHLQRALEMDANYVEAHFCLANTLLQMGRAEEAVSHLQRVLEMNPRDPEAQKNMAWVLATSPDARLRDGAKAVELAERANEFTGRKDPVVAATLAAAYAETGRFSEAILTAEDALRLTNGGGDTAVAQLLGEQLVLYQAHQPFRDNR